MRRCLENVRRYIQSYC